MKKIIGIILMLLGIASGAYVGIWVMFVRPILDAAYAFDTGMLTGTIICITILKCIFASVVGTAISYIGVVIGSYLMK